MNVIYQYSIWENVLINLHFDLLIAKITQINSYLSVIVFDMSSSSCFYDIMRLLCFWDLLMLPNFVSNVLLCVSKLSSSPFEWRVSACIILSTEKVMRGVVSFSYSFCDNFLKYGKKHIISNVIYIIANISQKQSCTPYLTASSSSWNSLSL